MSSGSGLIVAGVAGVLAVVVLAVWHDPIIRVLSWPRRYLRARGYEHELARHTAAGLRWELDHPGVCGGVTYGFVDYAATRNGPPWPLEPRWQSDMEAAGEPLPAWARPEGDRSSAFGLVSGSSGSDYHGGELPSAAEGGRPPSTATGGPGSEPYGVTGPATYPFGDVPEDPALDETWARLEQAWAQQSSAGIPPPARDPDSGAGEHGREDAQGTGTATREQRKELAHGDPLGNTGRGGAVPVTPAAAPGSRDATAMASPESGSRLATRFDVELAAECARYIREQDKDVTEYLGRLLGVTR